MTSAQASRLVVASLIVVSITAVLSEVGKGRTPKPRLFIAGGVLYLMLGLLSDFAPAIAGPLAVLVGVGVVVSEGQSAFGTIGKRLGNTKR